MKNERVVWGPIPAVIMTIVLFFFSQFMGVFLLILGAMLWGGETLTQTVNGISTESQYLFAGSVLTAATLIGSLYLFVRLTNNDLSVLGLRRISAKKLVGSTALGAAVYFTAALAVGVIVGILWPDLLNQEQDIGFSRSASGLQLVPIFISLVVLPPLAEELLCRGFLFGGLRSKLTFGYSALITSGLFAVAHLQFGGATPLVWAAAIDTFILSIVLCWQRERTGSLWAPITLHGFKNALAFASIFIFHWS